MFAQPNLGLIVGAHPGQLRRNAPGDIHAHARADRDHVRTSVAHELVRLKLGNIHTLVRIDMKATHNVVLVLCAERLHEAPSALLYSLCTVNRMVRLLSSTLDHSNASSAP